MCLSLACALMGWGQHPEVQATVAAVLFVIGVSTLEASPRGARRREVAP